MNQVSRSFSPLLAIVAIFAASSFGVWLLSSHILSPSLDEGIYLQGGHRVLLGQVIYRDFFAFAGPMVYWIGAALEALFGLQIPLLRIEVAIASGLIAIGSFAIAYRLAGLRAGVCAAIFWVALHIDLWNRLEINHRWLSIAFFSAAAVSLFYSNRVGRIHVLLAGAFLSLAAWTTQSFAWPLIILAVYFVVARRASAIYFFLGAALAGFVPLIVLASQGALAPMIENLRWVMTNYADANRVSYGYFFASIPLRYLPHMAISVTMVPLAAVAGLLLIFVKKEKDLIFPLVFVLSVFPTALPKWDALQLMFLMGPYFGFGVGILWRQLPKALEPLAQAVLLMPSVFCILAVYTTTSGMTSVPTRAGVLVGNPNNVTGMDEIQSAIPAGSSVFVFPYLSALYPLLHAENPTRYEYLQPGMMTDQDERKVLAELKKNPPRFIYWHNLPETEVMKIWPNTNPARLHFVHLEDFILTSYAPGVETTNSSFTGRVWTRKQ